MKAEQAKQENTGVTTEQPRQTDTRVAVGKPRGASAKHPPVPAKGKQQPRGNTWIWVVLILVVLVALIWMFFQANARRFESEMWVRVGDGRILRWMRTEDDRFRRAPIEVLSKYPNTEQGRIARFQLAWYLLWEEGIKNLGSQLAPQALEQIKSAREEYEKLYKEVKNDPVLAPEALYCIAVATETLAVEDRNLLKDARTRYNQVVEEFPKSAYAAKAEMRLKEFSDEVTSAEIAEYYASLENHVRQWRAVLEAHKQATQQQQKEQPGKVKGDK